MRKKQYIDFLKGKLNGQEAEEFMKWLNSPEGELEAINIIEQDWKNDDATDSMNDVRMHGMLNDIQESVGHKPSFETFRWRYYLRIAAVLLIGLGISVFVLEQKFQKTPQQNTVLAMKSNPVGQKSTIFLPDGTKVFLNAESTLTYPKQFSTNARTVELIGEAFFEVTRDESKPFIVTSGKFSTTALGTSFNVRAYSLEEIQSVSLATGKVLVQDLASNNGDSMFLVPGEHMSFSMVENAMKKSFFDEKATLGWKDGLIFFHKANLEEVMEKLSRWYGVKIMIKGTPDKNWTYQGEFKNESLEYVLTGMGLTKNFEYLIKNKNVTIDFK